MSAKFINHDTGMTREVSTAFISASPVDDESLKEYIRLRDEHLAEGGVINEFTWGQFLVATFTFTKEYKNDKHGN